VLALRPSSSPPCALGGVARPLAGTLEWKQQRWWKSFCLQWVDRGASHRCSGNDWWISRKDVLSGKVGAFHAATLVPDPVDIDTNAAVCYCLIIPVPCKTGAIHTSYVALLYHHLVHLRQ